MEWLVYLVLGLVGIGVFLAVRGQKRRETRRRDSLHRDSGGMYYWIDFDGSTQSSKTHPDEPGGAWSSDNGSSGSGGFFDGGGGDGGGGGGGD